MKLIQHCKIRNKTQTRTKRDKLKNTTTLFYRNLNRKSKQPLAIYQYQLISSSFFIYSWPLRPLITQYLAYDHKN